MYDGAVANPVSPAAAGVADSDDYGDAPCDYHHNEGLPERENVTLVAQELNYRPYPTIGSEICCIKNFSDEWNTYFRYSATSAATSPLVAMSSASGVKAQPTAPK